MLRGSAAPAAACRHRPGEPGKLQLRHAPVQLFSQHTPSTHRPDTHWLAAAQMWPFCILPQLPVVTPLMVCDTHWNPSAQSWSVVQVLVHAELVQRKGEQSTSPDSRQVPCPSQVRGVFSDRPAHEEGAHTVFAGKSAHEPKPSQTPLLPHVVGALAAHADGSATPAGRGWQLPLEPVWAHETQEPAQATLQHTESTQKPEEQPSFVVQSAPLGLLPQLPATH